MKQEHDLTEGNVRKVLLTFSLPFLIANLIQGALWSGGFNGSRVVLPAGKRGGSIHRDSGDSDYYQYDIRAYPGRHDTGRELCGGERMRKRPKKLSGLS